MCAKGARPGSEGPHVGAVPPTAGIGTMGPPTLPAPMFSTIKTCNKYGCRFIRRSCLHLIISTFFGPAFFTSIHIRRRFDIGIEFGGIAFDFLLNEIRPPFGIHFLMGHKGELLRGEFTRLECRYNFFIQIAMNGAKPVRIEL